MKTKDLYKYQEEIDGKKYITVSPIKPDCEYEPMLRLIADEGKELTNDGGTTRYHCVDVTAQDGWEEVDKPVTTEDSNTVSGS